MKTNLFPSETSSVCGSDMPGECLGSTLMTSPVVLKEEWITGAAEQVVTVLNLSETLSDCRVFLFRHQTKMVSQSTVLSKSFLDTGAKSNHLVRPLEAEWETALNRRVC